MAKKVSLPEITQTQQRQQKCFIIFRVLLSIILIVSNFVFCVQNVDVTHILKALDTVTVKGEYINRIISLIMYTEQNYTLLYIIYAALLFLPPFFMS